MKFTVTTSGYFYYDQEEIAKLKEIGFTFKSSHRKQFEIKGEPTVEIKDLKELMQFVDKWDEVIITDGNIEIYNDYRE